MTRIPNVVLHVYAGWRWMSNALQENLICFADFSNDPLHSLHTHHFHTGQALECPDINSCQTCSISCQGSHSCANATILTHECDTISIAVKEGSSFGLSDSEIYSSTSALSHTYLMQNEDESNINMRVSIFDESADTNEHECVESVFNATNARMFEYSIQYQIWR